MQKATSKRLMENLTGKETYAAIMQSYADVMQLKPPTFDNRALDCAKAGLGKRPHEEREFYRWCNARTVIDFLVAEIRVDAMQANWQLSHNMTNACHLIQGSPAKCITAEKLQSRAEVIKALLHKLTHYIAALDAFSEILNVDLSPLLRGVVSVLKKQLALYDGFSEVFDEYLTIEGGFTEVIKGYFPTLTLTPDEKTKRLQSELTENLRRHRADGFVSLIMPLID